MISMIVAIANKNVIGKDNKLIWHIPEDLKRFKEITNGHLIFMGRKTFESLPGVLPNRKHVVLTRDTDYCVKNENVLVVNTMDDFIDTYKDSDEEVFVIGGAKIYKQMLPHCNKIYFTMIHKDFDGDAFFPKIDDSEFTPVYKSVILVSEKENLKYSFIDVVRRK